jgi:hypothetical protein
MSSRSGFATLVLATLIIVVFIFAIALGRIIIHGDEAFGAHAPGDAQVELAEWRTFAQNVENHVVASADVAVEFSETSDRELSAQLLGDLERRFITEWDRQVDAPFLPECAGDVERAYLVYLLASGNVFGSMYYNMTAIVGEPIPMQNLVEYQTFTYNEFINSFNQSHEACTTGG